MFGKILKIEENYINIENLLKSTRSEFMNCHIIFEESDRKIVGEIIGINDQEIKVFLVGQILGSVFYPGVIKKPSTTPRVINVGELELIIGKQSLNKDYLLLGASAIYKNFNVSASVNELFANHLAIIGNTGSGKSCAVTRLLQNLFCSDLKPVNSHFILFDAYGEYKNAFEYMNHSGLGFKRVNTREDDASDSLLKIPVNFLEVDDLAILLSVNDADQIPVLEKTLKLVYIFTSTDERVKEYKNDIIAKCLLDALTSGKSSSQIRDQIIAILSHYNTEDLNLDSIIKQPGYDRTLKQCLNIDEQGKMNAILLVTDYLNTFTKISLDEIVIDKTTVYTLDDLYYALEFALISEGVLNSDKSYDKNNILKSRLQSIINSDYKNIFDANSYVTKENYINNFFSENGEKAQLVDINLSHVDDRFAKILTKLLSKIFFTYTTSLSARGTYPVNIVLEEAHRYVQNDNDINIIGYNIFDRITKEGRKYGCFLTFITQRPSELSSTSISQVSNFIVLRMFHPKDFDMIKEISTNVTFETLNRIKTLSSGTALVFGTGFKLPLLVNISLPSPMPESTSLKVNEMWY